MITAERSFISNIESLRCHPLDNVFMTEKNKHETIRVAVIKRCIPRGFFRVASCVINSKTRLFVEIKATLDSYGLFVG